MLAESLVLLRGGMLRLVSSTRRWTFRHGLLAHVRYTTLASRDVTRFENSPLLKLVQKRLQERKEIESQVSFIPRPAPSSKH